jgi:hypothetical protein
MNDEEASGNFKRIPALVGDQEPTAAGAASGEKEAVAIAAGTLEELSRQSEHQRSERLRNQVHYAIVVLIWLGGFLTALALLCVAWHHMVTVKWCWLSDVQESVLETFLFSGALFSAAGRYVATRIF